MAEKFTEFTPEQEELLNVVRDEWIANGLSTEPADWDLMLEGVNDAYQAASLEPPEYVVRLTSPMQGVIGSAFLRTADWDELLTPENQALFRIVQACDRLLPAESEPTMLEQVCVDVMGQIYQQVGVLSPDDKVYIKVLQKALGKKGSQLEDLEPKDLTAVQAKALSRLKVYMGKLDGENLWSIAGWPIYGQHDAGWLAFHDFFRRSGHPGLEEIERPLEGLTLAARSGGWWWPYTNVVVLTDRPAEIHRDAQGRLHSLTTAAISYRDGWSVWAVHGVRVPDWMILHPEQITPESILAEQNTEVRRTMIDIYGWDTFAEKGNLTLLDEKPDPGNGPRTLRLFELPPELRMIQNTPVRLLLVHNGTPERDGTRRTYGITVPVEITDAVAAAAWTFSLSAEEYAQLERAT